MQETVESGTGGPRPVFIEWTAACHIHRKTRKQNLGVDFRPVKLLKELDGSVMFGLRIAVGIEVCFSAPSIKHTLILKHMQKESAGTPQVISMEDLATSLLGAPQKSRNPTSSEDFRGQWWHTDRVHTDPVPA